MQIKLTRRTFNLALGSLALTAPIDNLKAQELAEVQHLQYAVGADDIKTVDPHFSVSTGEVIGPYYEGLLAFPDGVLTSEGLEPGLATEWSVAQDGVTWTFNLRKGVQWHRGHGEFTAEDVKFSIERVKDPAVASPFADSLSVIASVTVIDPHTVEIKTSRVEPSLPALLTNYQGGYIVSKHAVEAKVDLRTQPIGTGPFMYHEYRPRESQTLVRNENYWGGTPKIERMTILFMADDSTRELALLNGDVHGIELPARQDAVERMRSRDMIVDLMAPANTFLLLFNLKQKPLDDIRMRKALAGAIDRDTLVRFLGKDVATPEVSPLPSGYLGHTDDVPYTPYDPAKSQALLKEAGHADGLTLSMVISNSNIYLPPMQVIQEMWKRIGVNLELKVVDHPTYHRLIREDVNPVVIYGANRYPLTGTIILTQFFHSKSAIGKPSASLNFSHYGEVVPGVDELLDQARSELDQTKQVRLWEEAQRKITEDVVSVSLITRKYAAARTPKLDFGFNPKSYYEFNEKNRLLK
ncbi:ABC transporter substrate-binding protein [Rhizobium sp. CCGE532]|uniref:ABC transporter substrate-binding protein n=1 Tax=Rhizobium sp. CCGE532 TaxID=2364272 RepID=UPI000EA95DE4|nr:ABC transporter substrate-binding protein [Rhizobium sp. CCGE532]AYG76826.1 polyamine ABC transporter substrate-binding protein [Rhizobium sp. CCGE532]